MNKSLLMIFACVLLTVGGQEELRKDGRDAAHHQHLTQSSDIFKGKSENVTQERDKRMPDAKKLDDGSFGYAWNVGNGVSYMKMSIGKTNNRAGTDSFAAAQHEVINSLRDGGHSYLQNQNDKTGYEKVHKDFLKMSQQIASQRNKNLSVQPTIGNQKTLGTGKQEFNFKDNNFSSYEFNNEQHKRIIDAQNKFHDFNTKLKHEYDKFNEGVQFSGWPQHQAHSLKELNIAQNWKPLQSSVRSDYETVDASGTVEKKPINGFEFNQEFLKSLQNQQNFAFGGNLDDIYKSIEVPMQESSNDFAKGKEANFQGLDSDENIFKDVSEQNEEVRAAITNPLSVNIEQKHSSGVNDAVFKYIGESNYKTGGDEEHKIPNEFSRSQEEAWSTQNFVSSHRPNVEGTDYKQDSEESRKTIDEEIVQKGISEIPLTPQIEIGNQGSYFQINHESKGVENIFPQLANGYGNGFINEMHPMMKQKLIHDQVERIKQIQQKVIESHIPGAGIYDVLDGNAQHGFTIQGQPMQNQENIGLWKQDEYNKGGEQSGTRLADDLQNNHEVTNINYHEERPVPNVGTTSLNFNNGYSLRDPKRHKPFMNNNVPIPKFMQNQFFGRHELANDESATGSESHDGRDKETLWRPQRYSIKSAINNQHHTDLQNEFDKFKNEDSLKESDERKGREIKSGFEHEDSVHLDHKEIQAIDDHTGSEEHKEAKTSHAGSGYPQFHKYSHQEPQVRVITKAVPVHKELKIPVPQMVRHPILIPVPYKVLEPYPFQIPVPVTVEKRVEVPVEKVVHYPVEKPVPMKVVKEVRVPVPKPYPVKVPVYKIKYVHHNKKKRERV